METRYPPTQEGLKHYTTQDLRKELLIENLFVEGEVTRTYSMIDRVVVMGAQPKGLISIDLEKGLDPWAEFGVDYFLERRELGIINIGGAGVVSCWDDPTVGGQGFTLSTNEALYVGKETQMVRLSSRDPNNPAKFYMVSAPAHKKYPNKHITRALSIQQDLGSPETANERTINQLIHPDIVTTCQLMMGLTQLKSGSVWNTMPAHTHERRSEVYMYFNVPADQAVFHDLGEPQETRHILMHNEQAVLSPAYSIHCGSGTFNYDFIWAMAGENQQFNDMDGVPTPSLR